jgi:sugar phosphate isomerase/epimerase
MVHVNVPFCMLTEKYLGFVLDEGINPEIGLDAKALDETSDSTFKKISELLRERGLSVSFHAPFADLAPGSIDPQIHNATKYRFKQVIGLASIFHPKTVVCHTGYEALRHGYMKDQWIENSIAIWKWLSEQLMSEGTSLMLENVFETGPEEFLPIFDSLRSDSIGFCLDVGHQKAFSHCSLEKWLGVLGPFLGQLHLHDNNGDGDHHLAMGQGSVDFEYLFGFLGRMEDRRPLVTLEPHVDSDLWPSIQYLEENWPM